MKNTLSVVLLLFGSLIILLSCKNENKQTEFKDSVTNNETKRSPLSEKKEEQKKIPSANQTLIDSPYSAKSPSSIDWDKKIIKTATLKLEVKDFKTSNASVHEAVKKSGGYIAQEEQNTSNNNLETVVSIKVPVDQFESLMDELSKGETKVVEKRITTEDVTGQIIDTKSRLEAKKQMRLKYLEFLKQSKNMEEVLQVQNEINGIQEEIESGATRIDFLSHQSAFSTINLTFYQPLNGFNPNDSPSFFNRVGQAFKIGMSWIADLLVGLISIWPLIISILLVIFFIKKMKSNKIVSEKS